MLSYYWHRAFLLDYMFAAGHLADGPAADVAREALDETLKEANTSPLGKVAVQVINNSRHVWRTLLRVRRRDEEDEVVAESRSMMDDQWEEAAGYLKTLAAHYQARFDQLQLDNVIRVDEQEARPLRYVPLLEGETNDRRQESDPRLKTEESEAQDATGKGFNPRKSTAAAEEKTADQRATDDQEATDSKGE